MRHSKRGDLSLSVNAIVVFVLAFSMLGVGLFITNLIREKAGPAITESFNIELLQTPPTADNPITLQGNVNLKRGGQLKIDVGVYNKGVGTANNAKITVIDCIDEGGIPVEDAVTVVSPFVDVAPSKGAGFKIILKEGSGSLTPTNVCKMVVYDAGLTGSDPFDSSKLYESKQFFLNMIS